MSATVELRRIGDALERAVPDRTEPIVPPGPFVPALLTVLLRSCPDPELIRRVPGEYFEAVDRTAVVRCPCEWVPVLSPGVTACEGCERVYIWSGAELFSVKAEAGCRCSTVRRERDRWVCVDCGVAA